jgi:hypothetical protein
VLSIILSRTGICADWAVTTQSGTENGGPPGQSSPANGSKGPVVTNVKSLLAYSLPRTRNATILTNTLPYGILFVASKTKQQVNNQLMMNEKQKLQPHISILSPKPATVSPANQIY